MRPAKRRGIWIASAAAGLILITGLPAIHFALKGRSR
jgi:hypothetical protein